MRRFLAGGLPRNYTLCFSRKETNEAACREVLAAGGTVSVVFAGPKPARFWGYRVTDGDAHDLRFLDVPGRVVGLSAKGKALRDATGFVVRAAATGWPPAPPPPAAPGPVLVRWPACPDGVRPCPASATPARTAAVPPAAPSPRSPATADSAASV